MDNMAESVVSKFGQVLAEELQKIRGVGEKVVHLRDELATMKAVLRMFSEAEEGSIDHLVREWTNQVRELANDAEDCADMYWLRIRRPLPLPPIFVGGLVTCARNLHDRVKLLPNIATREVKKLLLRRDLASDVEALQARTTAINERRARYGIDREALRRSSCYAPVSAASVSASALRHPNDPNKFVGIQEYADKLAQMIKAPNGSDKKLKVFSIFGFGGLGKTTLAMKVCQQLVPEFPHQALVSVSQAFDGSKDVDELLKRVLEQIIKTRKEGHDDNNEDEVDTGERNLEKVLQDKRYG
jgi:disease resistance protein RPM1